MTAAFAATALLVTQAAVAQVGGLVEGRVVDARSGAPLGDAVVVLQPVSSGSVASSRRPYAQAALLRTATDADGRYRFRDLAVGSYVLRVERLGYRPARVEVALGHELSPRLTLGLEVEPIALEPVVVEAPATEPGYRDPRLTPVAGARVGTQEVRRRRYLETDAYIVDQEDIAAAGSFPEPDVMRAVQRLPGMSSRDGYAAELWTRGSGWEHTRVLLDDLPLFEPLMAGGALGGVGPGAVGAVFVHSGPRPVAIGEGGAGVVRLGTRRAREVEGLPFHAELGLGTVQGTTERRFLDGGAGVLVSGRQTWYDRVWNGLATDRYDPEGPFDYRAGSSLLRLDAALGDQREVVYGRYRGSDRLDGNAGMLITGTTGAWGNATDQLTLTTPLLGRAARVVVGRSDYDASVEESGAAFVPPVDPSVVVLRPGSTRIRYRKAAIELPYRGTSGGAGGVELTTQSLAAAGSAEAEFQGGAGSVAPSTGGATVASAWGSYRAAPTDRFEVELGARFDTGPTPARYGSVRLAPHLAVRHTTSPSLYLSVSARRSYQYLRRVAPAGTPFGSGHTFGHAWAVSSSDVPPLRTDLFSAGFEHSAAHGWWLSGTAWVRRASGAPVLDPAPGARIDAPVAWVAGQNRASGLELQLRRLAGPVTGHVSYGWLRSTNRVGSVEVPAPAERPHALDALITWSVRPTLRLGGSFVAYAGAPYTRRLTDSCVDDLGRIDGCATPPLTTFGPAGRHRTPGFATLDVSVDWVRRRETWGWGVSGHVYNVLGLRQTGAYRSTECPGALTPTQCAGSPFASDRFYALPSFVFPMVTFRAWF